MAFAWMPPLNMIFCLLAGSYFPQNARRRVSWGARVINNLDTMTPTGALAPTIRLNGRDYKLRFTMLSTMRLEALTGKNLAQNSELVQFIDRSKMSFTTVSQLIWAMVINDDPTLTVDQVASWIDFNELISLQQMTQEVLEESVAVPDPDSLPNVPRRLRRQQESTG